MKKSIRLTKKQLESISKPYTKKGKKVTKVRQGLIPYGDGEACSMDCGGIMEKKPSFKIATKGGDLENAHIVGDAGNILNEGLFNQKAKQLSKYFDSYNKFLIRHNIPIEPLPKVHLDTSNQGDDLLIKTGYYLPSSNEITLFVKDRHLKDILRSYAHEMLHRIQNLEDPKRNWGTGGDLKDDDILSDIEGDAYKRGNLLFRQWTEELRKNKRSLNESVDEIVYPEDVDLSSFQLHSTLNPKIWENHKLKPEISDKLEEIADDFVDFLNVSWVEPKDILIVGSIANYNWSEFSDIDLHIVIDFSEVDEKTELVEQYFNSMKKEWNNTHDSISIYGFPVELYVQDVSEKPASSGVYSIYEDKWLLEPSDDTFSPEDMDNDAIKQKSADYMTDIEDLELDFNDAEDEDDYGNIYDDTDELITTIRDKRKNGLKTSNDEMNTDNLVFKVLRRNGYLDRLFKLRDKSYDKEKSL